MIKFLGIFFLFIGVSIGLIAFITFLLRVIDPQLPRKILRKKTNYENIPSAQLMGMNIFLMLSAIFFIIFTCWMYLKYWK